MENSNEETMKHPINFSHGAIIDNKYKIIKPIGSGGMGAVYKVENLALKRPMAMKVILSRHNNPKTRERFRREATIGMELVNKHVVQIRHYEETTQFVYFTMDFHQGITLREHLKEKGTLPEKQALAICKQILSALIEGHKKGLLHRDIKPSNILLRSDIEENQALLFDFGIAKDLKKQEWQEDLTNEGFIGTIRYSSPEQLCTEKLDEKTDVYSLALTLYEMLAGPDHFPFFAPYQAKLLKPPAPFPKHAEVSPQLEKCIFKALTKERENRYGSAEFLREIENIIAQEKSPQIATKKRQLPVVVIVIFAIFFMIISIFFITNNTYQLSTQNFKQVLAKKEFFAAKEQIKNMENDIWISIAHKKQIGDLKKRLHQEQQNYYLSLEKRGKKYLQQNKFLEAISCFKAIGKWDQEKSKSLIKFASKLLTICKWMDQEKWQRANKALRTIKPRKTDIPFIKKALLTTQNIIAIKSLLTKQKWQQAINALSIAEAQAKETLSNNNLDFFKKSLQLCKQKLHWRSFCDKGREKITASNFTQALFFFEKAAKLEKDNPPKEISIVKKLLVTKKLLKQKKWQGALKLLQKIEEDRKQFPNLLIPFVKQEKQKAQQKIKVEELWQQLRESLQQNQWGDIPFLFSLLKQEVSSTERKQLDNIILNSIPVSLKFLARSKKGENWRDAINFYSQEQYKIELTVQEKICVYGYQKGSSGRFYALFPILDPFFTGGRKRSYFANPLQKGRREVGIFQIDQKPGVERFYILFSNRAIKSPQSVIADYLKKQSQYLSIPLTTALQQSLSRYSGDANKNVVMIIAVTIPHK